MAELLLGALLEVVFEKLASELILDFARRERIDKLLKRWTKTLSLIQAYIVDAEEKQLTETAVKKWLEHLKDLAYDLDDVLDEIYTKAHVERAKGVIGRSEKIWKFITPGAFMFKKKMKSKIEEISDRLEDIKRNGDTLNLSQNVGGSSGHSTNRLPSTSVVEPNVRGRDKDKEAICKLMMDDQENVSVIPIVGMGGIGKTTLAQLIYNDELIAGKFDLKAWACISEDFDVFTVTKTIFHSATQESAGEKDLNMLQESLRALLSKKKFLLILDDVWNKEYGKWEAFIRPFLVGLPGSKVLVTTRDDRIASMVGSGPSYRVNILSDDDCVSLLAQHALRTNSFDEHPRLKRVGEALARKCKGLPLAAKTLGGLLRSKERDEDWEDVLHSKIWNLPEENNILPVLRLSYHHLPPHLKHLFAYCSIFPKDYEFDKVELVLLWMAEGFLAQPKGRKTKEQLGFEYFDELLSRSFFQRLGSNGSRLVMHDLINDLAQFVAGGLCYKMDEKVETDDEYRIPQNTRHASFLRHRYEVFKKFKGFYQVKGLRTFLPMPVQDVWSNSYFSDRILIDLLPKLHSSRVLSVSGYLITELPDSICKLIHLRYLNLSGTSIVSLPESLKDLYNLEVLSIHKCHYIQKLPPAVGHLANLRHLDNSDTRQLTELPVEIGELESLQSLPKIVLSKDGGLGLRQLKNLELLRGKVALSELQNVSDAKDAKEASMRSKEIKELQLAWVSDVDDSRDGQLEHDVLEALQAHEYLEKLEIYFYGGVQFPSWIGDPSFSKVFSLSLSGCSQCTSLPPLGLLPELKHLRITNMPKIERIGIEFFGRHANSVPFSKLETLKLEFMPMWEEWSCFPDVLQMRFPFLHELYILSCPKLATVSLLSLPLLRNLILTKCSMVVLERLCDLGSLNYLKLASVEGLRHLPTELVQSMSTVEVLECRYCYELVSLWQNGVSIQHLNKLRRLNIDECPVFVSLGEEEQQRLCNVEILEVSHCASLASLPNDLRNLRELIIRHCPRIINFLEHAILPMLKRLTVQSCHNLESLPSDISNLESLCIRLCPSLRNWSASNFPNGLKTLSIEKCDKLELVPVEMFPSNRRISLEELHLTYWQNFSTLLQHACNFSRLTQLVLYGCDGPEYFPSQGLPPNLRILYVEWCSNLRSLPTQIQNMSSIIELAIHSCHELDLFPGCNFPPNLSSLSVKDCQELKPLSQWGLDQLTSLKEFIIGGGFEELQLLAEHYLFPSSLIKVSISRFPKLRSLSRVLDNQTSLRHLLIKDCRCLNDLPSENLLEKLWLLQIRNCPHLRKRCLKDGGDYWPRISGIPCVGIY